MDEADDILTAVRSLEAALERTESRLASALAVEHADRRMRDALHTEATRLRAELARLRREFAAHMAAHLRVW